MFVELLIYLLSYLKVKLKSGSKFVAIKACRCSLWDKLIGNGKEKEVTVEMKNTKREERVQFTIASYQSPFTFVHTVPS
jgi:hypothetical protein